ncbi:hypothetical protein ACS0TY_002047 [Phlomoides rotata]
MSMSCPHIFGLTSSPPSFANPHWSPGPLLLSGLPSYDYCLGGDLDKHDKELHSNGARASPTSVYPTLLVVIVGGEDDNINRCFPNLSIVIVEDEEDSIRVCIPNIIIVIVGDGGIAVGAFLPFTSFEFFAT